MGKRRRDDNNDAIDDGVTAKSVRVSDDGGTKDVTMMGGVTTERVENGELNVHKEYGVVEEEHAKDLGGSAVRSGGLEGKL